jgi:hypothetical protein
MPTQQDKILARLNQAEALLRDSKTDGAAAIARIF